MDTSPTIAVKPYNKRAQHLSLRVLNYIDVFMVVMVVTFFILAPVLDHSTASRVLDQSIVNHHYYVYDLGM